MIISLDLIQTMGLATLVFLLGSYIKKHVAVFRKYFIPAPVIGGLIFSILIYLSGYAGWFTFKLTMTLQDFFMNLFFTCTGFTCSIEIIKRSGRQGAILAVGAVLFLVVQNLVGVGMASVFNLNPLLGVAMGSISMSGGIGSGVAFGPILDAAGATDGTTVGVAAATFGLLMGSLIGGPVAHRLIAKYHLKSGAAQQGEEIKEAYELNEKRLFMSTLAILLAAAIGVYINQLLLLAGLRFPYFVGCIFGGMLVRNLADMKLVTIHQKEIDILGNISLNLFLSLALMSLNISKLVDLAAPMIVILILQAAVMMLWAYVVTFRTMGKDYEAAVMAAGHCGVGLGQTPNAIANMAAVIEKNGPAPNAWFVLPVITVLFINICNPVIITFFINYLK